MNPLESHVECYSGVVYAERPIAFQWEGTRYPVGVILARWIAPGRRCFRVAIPDGRRFELSYCEDLDEWRVEPL